MQFDSGSHLNPSHCSAKRHTACTSEKIYAEHPQATLAPTDNARVAVVESHDVLSRSSRLTRSGMRAAPSLLTKKCMKASGERLGKRGLTLPDYEHLPSKGGKGCSRGFVLVPIVLKLRQPVVGMGLWGGGTRAAGMLVPEAAVHKNHLAVAWKHQIGSSREVAAVEPEAKSH